MDKKVIATTNAPGAIGPYSQAWSVGDIESDRYYQRTRRHRPLFPGLVCGRYGIRLRPDPRGSRYR